MLESSKPSLKKNQQSPSVKYQTSSDASQLSISSAWPSTRNLWSNFNDDFFSKGFDGTSFGNWRSDIEERSNRVLNGYNTDPPKVKTSSEGNLIHLKLERTRQMFIIKECITRITTIAICTIFSK